jgi:hypothetical protein
MKKQRSPLIFEAQKVGPIPDSANTSTSLIANEKTRKGANSLAKTGRAGRQFIAAHVLPEAAKQLKLLAVQEDKTTQEILVEAINDLFAKHGLSRIA